ncbi:Trithorax group protein osa-like protein, partial [Leptotrombidium deliense]
MLVSQKFSLILTRISLQRPDGLLKLYDMSDEPDRKVFLDKLIAYNEERGVTLSSCPTISKQPLDLYKLYVMVKDRGGFSDVTRQKLWKECAQLCNIAHSSSAAYTLRKQYIKHLLPFECKYDRGGIDHQLIISQTENSNRKKAKGAPSPGPGDSNSQGSYPLSGTPGQVEGPYPQHIPQQPNSYPPTMQQFPPPPGMSAPEYPPNVHQGSYPHPPPNAGPPQHLSAQIPPSVAANHTTTGGESISAQDPFSDEMQPSTNYNHQRHPSGPPPANVSQPPPMSVPSQGPPVSSTHTNSYNYNTPNYPSNAPGPGYYPPQSITPSMHHDQFSGDQNANSEYANRQQGQMPPTVPATPESYSSGQPQSTRSYSPNRSAPPAVGAQSSAGQPPYYNHQGYDYNRDNRGYDQRHSAPGQTQPPPQPPQQSSVPPQQPPVPASTSGPSQGPPTSSHLNANYNTYNNPSYASNTQPSGKIYNSGPQHHEQFSSESPSAAPEYANRTQSTPTPGQQQSIPEPFANSVTNSGGYVANRAVQPSGQNYYGQQCYDYNRDNRGYERSADNLYGQQTPQQSVTQRGQMYPTSTQPSQLQANVMGYPPRGAGQQPYSAVGQQSDAYRTNEMSGYQTGVYQNSPANVYSPNTATPVNKLGPPSQSPTPPPNALRDSAIYVQGSAYPVPKRHPDFMKQEQQGYPMNSYGQAPPSSQYPHYPSGNRHSSVSSSANNPPNQMWVREAAYRYGPPSGAPGAQYGPPPPRESWDPMNVRPDGNWSMNRYNAVPSQPSQAFGSNSEYYVNSYAQSGGHPINKMSYGPRPNDPNRMYAPSQMPGSNMASKPPHIPHLHMNSNSSPSPGPAGYPNAPPSSTLPHHHLSFQTVKKEIVFPSDSVEASQPTLLKRRKLNAKDITQVEAWRLLMCLKSGLLAESTWALDVLSILVHDDNTVLYFGLQHLPGLLEVLLEHYKKYLSECFEGIFKNSDLDAEDTCNDIKADKKWYEVDNDFKENCDSYVDASSDDELTFTSKTNKLLVNIPKVEEQLVLLNSVNYTYKTRDGKPVRVKNSKNLFVIDYEKKWDLQDDSLFSATEHWENGVGQFLSHIQTHFESSEKFLRFAKVLKDKSLPNKVDVESDSSSNDKKKSALNSVHINCKKETVLQSPSNVPLDSDCSMSNDEMACVESEEDGRDE